jgi:pyruvate dehydrogenase E1 component alpha subunit
VAEAANIAGAWRLPVVFVINNNGWAISVPRKSQTAAETLAQKAIAFGMPGLQVDGNDVVAVQDVVGRAIESARRGEGPSWIEAVTYRLSDHTTADDAGRYRDTAEVSAAWKADPIARLRTYLVNEKAWGRADEDELLKSCNAEVEAATAAYLAMPPQPPEAIFDHLYETLPAPLVPQRQRFLAEIAARG